MTARAVDYLRFPEEYGRKLGGLRWASTGEAIELADGSTFALAPELAVFVSGFAARARLVHFAYVLHSFALLTKSRGDEPGLSEPDPRLRQAFARTGRKLRNAGSLFAHLTERLPRTASSFDAGEVCRVLERSTSAAAEIAFDDAEATKGEILDAGPEPTAHLRSLLGALEAVARNRELPPVPFERFEAHVRAELAKLDEATLESWLRHGEPTAPGAGEAIARAALVERPTLADVLAKAAERPRLSGSQPLLLQLASALVLPPRRLEAMDLPLGGYSDVTTRGHFEQVLPFQLALDELELVRRFASNELLFFRREEPRSRVREEVLVLVDQGARTWGPVRVVLGAAALALGKLAARRGTGCLYAATSSEGAILDPVLAGEAALGALLEASDLTLDPGAALERVLEDRTDAARDVVLLTHPRALGERSVAAAARRAQKPLRLFAVTADDQGCVELSELRHGAPVPLSRLKVDLTARPAPRPAPAAPATITDATAWKGDVERVPFPFAFGPIGQLGPRSFDFDPSGAWLLVVGRHGIVFAYRTDGTAAEVWPRGVAPTHAGVPLHEVEAVLGVPGGFAVCGRIHSDLVVAHYDLSWRRCRTHVLAKHEDRRWSWLSIDYLHSIAVRRVEAGPGPSQGQSPSPGKVIAHAVDLGTGDLAVSLEGKQHQGPPRARMAVARAVEPRGAAQPPPPELSVQRGPAAGGEPAGVTIDPQTGQVLVSAPAWMPFVPLRDGKPFLQKSKPSSARLRSDVLALATWDEGPITQGLPVNLRLFRRDGLQRGEYELLSDRSGYQLSHDGRLVALDVGKSRVEVRPVEGGAPVLVTTPGRHHNHLELVLGDMWLAAELPARLVHIIRWDGEQLLAYPVAYRPGNPTSLETVVGRELAGVALREPGVRASRRSVPAWLDAEPPRWMTAATAEVTAATDRYGHIAVFDVEKRLVAVLFVWRREVAAWLPDGTRLGPSRLTGAAPTPDARRKVARALRSATERGRRPA